MSIPEFNAWMDFHALFPFDDFHRFHRPAALIATAGVVREERNEALSNAVEWLQPDSRTAHMSDADKNTLKAFGYVPQAKE